MKKMELCTTATSNNVCISIIVPIFNASEYISFCLESLLNQSFKNIEYILIDDCSTDNTMELVLAVLDKFPSRKTSIKIFKNSQNRGLGYTRKFGLSQAIGDYVLQIDSDDWLEYDACELMYEKAISETSDIVVADYYENYSDYQKYISQSCTRKMDFISVLLGTLHSGVWNKLIKRELYINNDIYPSEDFSLYEDKAVMVPLFFYAKKISYINKAFLHYRKHPHSMTSVHNIKYISDGIKFIKLIELFFVKHNLLNEFEFEFRSFVLYHKKIFLLDKKYFHYWDEYYPEVNHIRYVFGIQSYGVVKKFVTILSMVANRNIMSCMYKIYKIYRASLFKK